MPHTPTPTGSATASIAVVLAPDQLGAIIDALAWINAHIDPEIGLGEIVTDAIDDWLANFRIDFSRDDLDEPPDRRTQPAPASRSHSVIGNQ